jgi:transposase
MVQFRYESEAMKMVKYDVLIKLLAKTFGKRGAKIIVCLVLMCFGITNSEIKASFGTSFDALRKYRKALEKSEIDSLFELKSERQKSELDAYSDIIQADFEAAPPKTLREAQVRIAKLTGIKRSLNRLCAFLKKRASEQER